MSKTRKYVILSSIITALCLTFVCVNTKPVKAYSSNTSPVTIESHMGEITTTHIEVVITLNFADYYSGYITFTIYNRSGQPVSYYALNAKLTNMTNTGFRTEVYQTKYAEVHIFYQTESLQQACYNAGLIASNTFGLFTTYLNTNWKTTTDVKTSTWSSNTLYVDSPVDEINENVATIETNIDTTNELLTQLINGGITINGGSATQVTVNSGTVWPIYSTAFILMMNKMGFTWTESVQEQMTVGNGISDSTTQATRNEFYVPPESTLNIIYYSNSANLYLLDDGETNYSNLATNYSKSIVDNLYGVVLMHVKITNTTSDYRKCWWYQANSGIYYMPVYWGTSIPDEVLEIINDDTKVIDKMNEIIQAIQNINLTVENDTEINNYVTANDNSITTITNDHETVNNITNDFNIDFGTADNAITLDLDTLPDLTNTATFWNGKAGDLDVELGDFHYPIWLGFVLLAIMAMIGV